MIGHSHRCSIFTHTDHSLFFAWSLTHLLLHFYSECRPLTRLSTLHAPLSFLLRAETRRSNLITRGEGGRGQGAYSQTLSAITKHISKGHKRDWSGFSWMLSTLLVQRTRQTIARLINLLVEILLIPIPWQCPSQATLPFLLYQTGIQPCSIHCIIKATCLSIDCRLCNNWQWPTAVWGLISNASNWQ